MDVVRNHDRSETSQEITRLRIDNATLRAENDGLKRLLSEREKVVALREQSSRREPFWRWWLHQKEVKQPANESSYERDMAKGSGSCVGSVNGCSAPSRNSFCGMHGRP